MALLQIEFKNVSFKLADKEREKLKIIKTKAKVLKTRPFPHTKNMAQEFNVKWKFVDKIARFHDLLFYKQNARTGHLYDFIFVVGQLFALN